MNTSALSGPLRQLAKHSGDELPAFVWPGGYPLTYITKGGSTLCAECATKNEFVSDPVDGVYVHWEGSPIVCDECNTKSSPPMAS